MRNLKVPLCILAILFGVFMVVYGGMDDSPGGQLLGLLAIIAGAVVLVRRNK